MGALRYQRPRVILFHTDCEPHGDYWEALRRIAGEKLKVVKRSPPEKIWGLDIKVQDDLLVWRNCVYFVFIELLKIVRFFGGFTFAKVKVHLT